VSRCVIDLRSVTSGDHNLFIKQQDWPARLVSSSYWPTLLRIYHDISSAISSTVILSAAIAFLFLFSWHDEKYSDISLPCPDICTASDIEDAQAHIYMTLVIAFQDAPPRYQRHIDMRWNPHFGHLQYPRLYISTLLETRIFREQRKQQLKPASEPVSARFALLKTDCFLAPRWPLTIDQFSPYPFYTSCATYFVISWYDIYLARCCVHKVVRCCRKISLFLDDTHRSEKIN